MFTKADLAKVTELRQAATDLAVKLQTAELDCGEVPLAMTLLKVSTTCYTFEKRAGKSPKLAPATKT